MRTLIALCSGMILCGAAQAADLLVAKGATGTLSVQYEYSSVGKNTNHFESAEWRVQRTINLTVPMTAAPPQPISALRGEDKAHAAEIQKKQASVQSLHEKMAPTMNDMMKIAEDCDDDEACITKAIENYGKTMDKSLIASAQKDVAAASGISASRYQIWQAASQQGTYLIDETYRAETSDPLCSGKPNKRCKREETRKGGGDIPPLPSGESSSAAMLEVDSLNKDVLIKLPVPMNQLSYVRHVTTDFPDDKSGTFQGTIPYMLGKQRSLTAVIPGGLRSASGRQSFKLDGDGPEGDTLVVKWQFKLQ